MGLPTEISYHSCDSSITDLAISDIEDDLSTQWLASFHNDNDKPEDEEPRKSRRRRSKRRNRQERLSLSNRVDATLNDSNGTNSDTPPSIPKKRSDFISSVDADKNIKNDNHDDGTRDPSPSSLLDASEHVHNRRSSTKTVDSPPFVPRRKGSLTAGIDNPLVTTLTSAEFLKTLAMLDNENNEIKTGDFLPVTGPEEVCDVLDYILNMELEGI